AYSTTRVSVSSLHDALPISVRTFGRIARDSFGTRCASISRPMMDGVVPREFRPHSERQAHLHRPGGATMFGPRPHYRPGSIRGWLLRSMAEDVGPVVVWPCGAGPLDRSAFHAHSFALEDGLMSNRGLEGVVVAETELSKIY